MTISGLTVNQILTATRSAKRKTAQPREHSESEKKSISKISKPKLVNSRRHQTQPTMRMVCSVRKLRGYRLNCESTGNVCR